MNRRSGFTLLEAMVALVILSLVVVAALELFGTSVRAASNADNWSRAVAIAEDGMERMKLDVAAQAAVPASEALPGGFERTVSRVPWRDRLDLITVAVRLPEGGEVALRRLVEVR